MALHCTLFKLGCLKQWLSPLCPTFLVWFDLALCFVHHQSVPAACELRFLKLLLVLIKLLPELRDL